MRISFLFLLLTQIAAFQPQRVKVRSNAALDALTERQMQFWEDVEDGLDDIESYWARKGFDIDRIRQFGKR
jgi:hypothetical protein